MCPIQRGDLHNSAPIPVEGAMVSPKDVIAISGLSHGVGTCAPQQGAAKLTLNVKNGNLNWDPYFSECAPHGPLNWDR